jgi:hypothetical protein
MKDVDLILSNDIFVNKSYTNKKLKTLATDVFNDDSIVYNMNEHGYRSNSIKDKSDYNILTLGCSWTMGIGVKNEFIWPTQLRNKIGKGTLFNYGNYGVSTSFIAKTFHKFVSSQFTPNVVFIMWPGFSRRDYIKEDGSFKKVGGFRPAQSNDVVWKNDDEDLMFIQLRNDYQDLMLFWEAYTFVETIAKLHNIKIYHTIAGYYYDVFKELKPHLKYTINSNTFFEPTNCYKNDNLARDCEHPGENWHIQFANSFYEFIKETIN